MDEVPADIRRKHCSHSLVQDESLEGQNISRKCRNILLNWVKLSLIFSPVWKNISIDRKC